MHASQHHDIHKTMLENEPRNVELQSSKREETKKRNSKGSKILVKKNKEIKVAV